MIDYGLINTIKTKLANDEILGRNGIEASVHSYCPSTKNYPLILLELEEIWSSLKLGAQSGFTKIKIKASTLSQALSSRESITISDRIRQLLDGQIIPTEDGKTGTVKLTHSTVDIPSTMKPMSVHQYFEILVRDQ